MQLDFAKLREKLGTQDTLGLYGEYLTVLETLLSGMSGDFTSTDTAHMARVLEQKKRVRGLCRAIYNKLNENAPREELDELVSQLEQSAHALDELVAAGA